MVENTGKNFALIGCAGYVAPRHLQAIKDTGNRLVAALDLHDSVGILDKFFPDARFFTEFERFDRHIEKLRRADEKDRVHYVSICSPNYLHDAHVRFAFRIGANAICEKPLVINPWNLDALAKLELETNKKVFCILQLRRHPSLIELKKKVERESYPIKHEVELDYVTPRGKWYKESWKGDVKKSGGIVTNLGVHFFDMLIWIFGRVEGFEVNYSDKNKISGKLRLEKANVIWSLSTDKQDIPEKVLTHGNSAYRSIKIDGVELEFSNVFNELHTEVYKEILEGRGFGIEDVRPSIQLTQDIRNYKNA